MAPPYSTQFYVGVPPTYPEMTELVVPDATIWIVQDITGAGDAGDILWCDVGTVPDGAVSIGLIAPDDGVGLVHWQGKVVLMPGDSLNVYQSASSFGGIWSGVALQEP